jgi:hypothetical protein
MGVNMSSIVNAINRLISRSWGVKRKQKKYFNLETLESRILLCANPIIDSDFDSFIAHEYKASDYVFENEYAKRTKQIIEASLNKNQEWDITDEYTKLVKHPILNDLLQRIPQELIYSEPQKTNDAITIDQNQTFSGDINRDDELINLGIFMPGNSPGIEYLESFTQGESGELHIEIGGNTPGAQYDQLNISGDATLDGKLSISLIDGFTPEVGDTFDIMTYESHSGQFATADGLFGFDDGSLYFDIVEQSDRLQLVVKEMPGGEFCIHAMNESHKNDLGELLNYDYFVDLPSSIEISGTGPKSKINLDMAGADGQLIRAKGNLDIVISEFFFVQGAFGFEKFSKKVNLADGTQVDTDYLALGGEHITAFAGLNGPE